MGVSKSLLLGEDGTTAVVRTVSFDIGSLGTLLLKMSSIKRDET